MSEPTAKRNNIKTSKLIQLLEVLSPLELKRLKKFLESPFHNSNELLVQLFGLLKKYHPTYEAPSLTKEKLFTKLFGNKPYRPKRINDLMSDMRQLVEDFLIVSDALGVKQKRQKHLVEVLAGRNHPSFEAESQKLITAIKQKTTYLTGEDYLLLHQINDQLWFHIDTEKNNNDASVFRIAHENLDLYYVLTKLQYFAEQAGRRKIYNEEEINTFKEVIYDYVNQKDVSLKHPLIPIFYRIILLIENELKDSDFSNLRKTILGNTRLFDDEIARDLILHLIYYCANKKNRGGNAHYIKIIFDLYLFLINNDLILINGKIRDLDYLNIINCATKVTEEEWITSFCEKYNGFLDNKSANEIINIGLVYKFFYQKNYEKIDKPFSLISLVNRNLLYPRIKAKIIKSLFEEWERFDTNNSLTIIDHSNAFEQFLKRNKVYSYEKKASYLGFVKFVKILVKIKKSLTVNKEKVEQLRKAIQQENFLTYKSWLLERIDALK